MAQNLPTAFYDSEEVNARQIETPEADFIDGMNLGGSCSMGIGVNSGDYDPKAQDWAQVTPRYANSGYIGIDSGANTRLNFIQGSDINDQVGFAPADASTAPDAEINASIGNVNKTGKTVPIDAWAFGPVPFASPLTALILKATGTYLNDAAIIQLTGEGYAPGLTLEVSGTRDTLGAWGTGPFVTTAETLDGAMQEFAEYIRGNTEMTADAAGNHVNLRAENGGISVTVSVFTAT